MRHKTFINTVLMLSTGLALGVVLGWKARTFPPGSIPNGRATEGLETPIEDGGHDHEEPASGALHDLSELESMTCEHGVGIIACDSCRFEVGAVKIDPSLASLIETGSVQEVDRTGTLTLTGQIRLDRTRAVEVVPTGGGRVKEIKRLLGEKVRKILGHAQEILRRKGDVLAVIHSADLGQTQADFLEVQARHELAEATFKREKELYEKKVSSEADYLAALNALKAAQAAYAAADKRLRLFDLSTEQIAGIEDEQQNGEFADLILRAPQSGTIITQNISVGQIVESTESLYTIADLSNVWVWCDVYEASLAALHERFSQEKPLGATVRVRAYESEMFNGIVDFVGHVMDEHTRTVKLRVQMENPETKLRPGMFVDVEVDMRKPGQVAAVPLSAVMSDAGKHFVFQQWQHDLWVRRDITIGDKVGNLVEVLDGVSTGARIVTAGAFMLKSDVLREKMGAGCAD